MTDEVFTVKVGTEKWHGTINGYNNRKCRCDACRDVIAEYKRAHRQKWRELGLPWNDSRHGTATGYENWSCRCNDCRAAVRRKGYWNR